MDESIRIYCYGSSALSAEQSETLVEIAEAIRTICYAFLRSDSVRVRRRNSRSYSHNLLHSVLHLQQVLMPRRNGRIHSHLLLHDLRDMAASGTRLSKLPWQFASLVTSSWLVDHLAHTWSKLPWRFASFATSMNNSIG